MQPFRSVGTGSVESPTISGATWRLGEFVVVPELNSLGRDGEQRRLDPTCMNVLVYLMERAPHVVSAAELLEQFWPNAYTEESTIYRRINQIRDCLGDRPRNPDYIETVSKRGYRVIATVQRTASDGTDASAGATRAPTTNARKRAIRNAGLGGIVAVLIAISWWQLFKPVSGVTRGPVEPSVETGNKDAFDLILEARALFPNANLERLNHAEVLLKRAISLEPNLAEAHARLAETILLRTFSGVDWSDVSEQAIAVSDHALSLDPESVPGLVVRARMEWQWRGNVDVAERYYARAFAVNANHPDLLESYGNWLLVGHEKPEEALHYFERALQFSPLSPGAHHGLARALLLVDRKREATDAISRGLRYTPDNPSLVNLAASMRFADGELFEYLEAKLHLLDLDPANSELLFDVVYVLSQVGEEQIAEHWVQRISDTSSTNIWMFYARLALHYAREDGDALLLLSDRWQSINTDHRRPLFLLGTRIPLSQLARACGLFLQANAAADADDKELARTLRETGIRTSAPILFDDNAEPTVTAMNFYLGIEYALAERLLGKDVNKRLLQAMTTYPDPYRDVVMGKVIARLLLGETEEALSFLEDNQRSLLNFTILKRIHRNDGRVFDDVTRNPRFHSAYANTEDSYSALHERLVRLPGLADASRGLGQSNTRP